MSNTNSLLAKGYYTEHGAPANLLAGWEAHKIGDDKFKIIRSDTTTLEVSVGDVIPKGGKVDIDANGDLLIGGYKVFQGKNLVSGWYAKPSRGKSFTVFDAAGNRLKAKVGEYLKDFGTVEIGEDGNLSANGKSIKVLKKTKELQLLVYRDKKDGGHGAYFNVIEPGASQNRKDGAKGVFFPSLNGQPAKFAENIGGKLVTTATFTPDTNGKLATLEIFSIESSMEQESISKQKEEVEALCKDLGINPDDNQEYVALESLSESLNTVTEKVPFSINNGHYLFGLKGRSYNRASSGYSR